MANLARPCIEHTQAGPRYSRVWHRGKLRCGHVQSWELANGREVPEGWHVDHLCFNPRCILPDHLEAVPAVVNVRRQRNVRLSIDIAEAIRRDYAALPRGDRIGSERPGRPRKTDRPVKVARGARAALAARYGVSVEQVRDIAKGTAWAR